MPGVLYLVHGLPPEEYTGTPLVAAGYAAGMARRGWETAVVYASPTADGDADSGVAPGDGVRRFPVQPSESNGLLWAIEEYGRGDRCEDERFEAVLDDVAPDLVHVIDNVSLPLAWPEQAAARGIPVVRTVSAAEDLCGLIVPVSPASDPIGYCEAPITPARCARCVAAVFDDRWGPTEDGASLPSGPLTEAMLASRRARLVGALTAKRERAWRQFEDVFDLVLFSTDAWRRYFEATLPIDPSRARVLPMGIELHDWPAERTRRTRAAGVPLVLVWATTLEAARGVVDVVAAFTDPRLLARDDYRLVVHGGGDPRLLDALTAVNPQVEIAGRYEAPQLPRLLAEADVGLSASLFETFHRVTREYLLAGLPVVANPTFGISDLIRHGENGLIYEHTRPGSLADAVITLLDDPALEARLADGARRTPVRSVDDEVDELAAIYEEVLRRPT